jgi:hypothetical protein
MKNLNDLSEHEILALAIFSKEKMSAFMQNSPTDSAGIFPHPLHRLTL